MHDLDERNPVRALTQYLGGPLEPGQVAVISARPGVGKSQLLVHLALDRLLRDVNVLHVALEETVEHVRTHYDQVFRAAPSFAGRTGRSRASDRAAALVSAERHRMIHTWYGRQFTVDALERSLDLLGEMASFQPSLVVIDGVSRDDAAEVVERLAALAADRSLAIWVALDEHIVEEDSTVWKHVRVGLHLEPEDSTVRLTRLDPDGQSEELPLSLDPTTMLVLRDDATLDGAAASVPRAADCTLYSGGANGSEAAFGEAAEKWGMQEVNFTFDGHKQVRNRGRYLLSDRELAAGDVSLRYVSRRLSRTYSEGTLIRKVLQTLWHMVSRSQQVFVIGQIQDDGTVVGGTGWSVELARMWNKDLWVFDQDHGRWFRWDGDDWVPGIPRIDSAHITGTGTRYLDGSGRAAIEELFQRSFEG